MSPNFKWCFWFAHASTQREYVSFTFIQLAKVLALCFSNFTRQFIYRVRRSVDTPSSYLGLHRIYCDKSVESVLAIPIRMRASSWGLLDAFLVSGTWTHIAFVKGKWINHFSITKKLLYAPNMEPAGNYDIPTPCLQGKCSAAELCRHLKGSARSFNRA